MLMMGQSSTCGWSFLVLLLSVVSSQASNLRSTGDFVPETVSTFPVQILLEGV